VDLKRKPALGLTSSSHAFTHFVQLRHEKNFRPEASCLILDYAKSKHKEWSRAETLSETFS